MGTCVFCGYYSGYDNVCARCRPIRIGSWVYLTAIQGNYYDDPYLRRGLEGPDWFTRLSNEEAIKFTQEEERRMGHH